MPAQNFDQIVAFGKETVDAIVQSSTLAAKGFEELAKVYTDQANHSIEQTTAAVKALTAAKTPADFQIICSSLAKTNLETLVSESRKIQELTHSIVAESAAPLNARVQALTGIFKAA